MSNTQDIPLASIQATLEHHVALAQGYLPNRLLTTIPRFDVVPPRLATEVPGVDYAKQIYSLGFPAPLASDVVAAVAQESQQYQAFVEQVRLRLLAELSTTCVTPDTSAVPSLVDAACNSFRSLLINSGLEAIQKVASEALAEGGESDLQSDSEIDFSSSEDSDNDEGDEELFDQADEDDNTPIKPGEDVPPLETKYLPIFEALHERGKVLTKPEKTYLVNMTGMTYRQITIWFQNRRRGELKESTNLPTYSKASSTHSDDSSEFSEQDLEKNLGPYPANTFDIRSWRLQSALATKDDSHGSIGPFSPFKSNFPSVVNPSDIQSDTDLSDDSDGDIPVSPGLQAPSLATSTTTVDSVSTDNVLGDAATNLGNKLPPSTNETLFPSREAAQARPIRGLPTLRRSSPSSQPRAQDYYSHSLNDQSDAPPCGSHQPGDMDNPPSQRVSSDERGLTIDMDATSQLQTGTLRPTPLIPASVTIASGSPGVSQSPPSITTGSPRRQPSPASSVSPRPHIKPLPRRTGCAPRPRPPPRLGSSISAPTPTNNSSRPSVVLPPSSNPSLGNTTLGALLRPNPPAPTIPREIEERLTAMAGRMGVGTTSGSGSQTARISSSTSRVSGAPRNSIFSGQNAVFSLGPTSSPNTGISLGAQPVSEQAAQGSTNRLYPS